MMKNTCVLISIVALSLVAAIMPAAAATSRTAQGVAYSFRPATGTGYAFTLADTGRVVTLQARVAGNNHQMWTEEFAADKKSFRLVNKARNAMCLAIPNADPGKDVFAYECDPAIKDHYWTWTQRQRLVNTATGKAAAPAEVKAGSKIKQWDPAKPEAKLVRYRY